MASGFGKGFITNIMLISKHLGFSPDRAWSGLSDHMTQMILPEEWKGTEIEEIFKLLRQQIMWHQPGMMDEEDLETVKKTMKRLTIAIDKKLGIDSPDAGAYD